MSTDNRRVVFDFIGRDQVSATMRRIGEEADSLDKRTAVLTAGLGALAGPAAAAGVAFGAFGAVAAPSIMKVVSAQEDLAESWDSLSTRQRESALLVRGLTDDFKALSKSYEPQALAAFNTVIGTGRALMPQFAAVVDAGAVGVQNLLRRVTAFAEGPQVAEFLRFAADTGPAALDQLGQAATTTGSIAMQTVQDMAPLGLSVLQLANGALTGVNALAQLNPAMTQLLLGTILLRGPVTAMVGGLSNMSTRMRDAANNGENLTRKQKALNLATAAGPSLYIAAGLALGLMALKAATAKNEHEKLTTSLKSINKATGNNVHGYQATKVALQAYVDDGLRAVDRYQQLAATSTNHMTKEVLDAKQAAEDAITTQKRLGREIQSLDVSIRNINTGAAELSRMLNVSEAEARDLATAAGVDLSQAIDKTGRLSADAAAKVSQYKAAAEQANNPSWRLAEAMRILSQHTSTAEQKTQALAAAYNAELGPAIAVFNATNQLRDGYAQLSDQLGKARGGMNGSGEASRQLQSAFSSQIDTVWRLYTALQEKTGSTRAGTAAVRDQLPVLYALAGRNDSLRKMVDALARATGNAGLKMRVSREEFLRTASSMGIAKDRAEKLWREMSKIKDRDVDLHVSGTGHWSVNNPGVTSWPRGPGGHRAMGGPIPASWALGPGGPTSDDVPAWLSVGEHVWTAAEVRAAGGHEAMERLRAAARAGHLQAFATGGKVDLARRGSTSRVADDVLQPIDAGYLAMVRSMAEAMVDKWKKYAVLSGGSVVGAARSMIGYPYSWGGGGIGGPSYGIGRGAGTFGFDCSGLTEYAWWKGRGISIGGVTYTQHPNSVAIGSPRPGALGFNASLGHVVLASDRPGYVIEAPYTGSFVREVRKSMPDWRWPRAAFYAGGPVKALGELATSEWAMRADRQAARIAQVAGDPSRRRGRGGPVAPGTAYWVGEAGPEVFVPRVGGTVQPTAQVVEVHNHFDIRVPTAYHKGAVAAEIRELLVHDAKNGGKSPWERRS